MQTLFKSFREMEGRYITVIGCPLFLSNVPQTGSYKVSQRTGLNIFLVIILLNAEISLVSLQCKGFVEFIVNSEVLYI